ncbi:hypothetical protein [Actinoplanes subglobosus]|uniref:Uncharacterized protein n=1 Tax=Actinoplanes subglobosus TaxID=1547892 RepID=A0ABV8J2M7_9ACTN
MTGDPLREFDDGLAFWKTRPRWPQDLHNSFYTARQSKTDGTFGPPWWEDTLRHLFRWRATRGSTFEDLRRRFEENHAALVTVWQDVILPRLGADITTVSWDDVRALPDLAARIKPTAGSSGVFPSKLSHFIAPRLFPVLDRLALGGGSDYGRYFELVQQTWAGTEPADRELLRQRLTAHVHAHSGGTMVNGYPVVNKIVELRLIGRAHPSAL